MGLSDNDADKRLRKLKLINAGLADVEAARKLVNDAKAALGTATSELGKLEEAYMAQRRELLRLLPDMGTVYGDEDER